MRSSAILVALLVVVDVRGETVDATFTTLVAGRQDPRDGNLYSSVPLYENVALMVSDVRLRHVDDLRVVVAGWGEVTLGGTPIWDGPNGDLDLGFVEGKLFDRRLELRLG